MVGEIGASINSTFSILVPDKSRYVCLRDVLIQLLLLSEAALHSMNEASNTGLMHN